MNSEWQARPADPGLIAQARIVEAVEAAAWADSFATAAAGDLGAATARIGDATVMRMKKLAAGFCCKVIGLGMEQPATAARVRDILAWYHDAGYADIWFQPSPAARPDGLLALLEGCGIRPIARTWGKFVHKAGAPPDTRTDLRICEIGADAAGDFASCAVDGFELPDFLSPWVGALPGRAGWRCYVAYDGTTPAACGALFRSGDAGFFGFDATRPAFRRRGAQGALMARRIADAGAAGIRTLTCETGVDESGPGPSWRNITRAGFRLLYVRPNCSPAAA